MTTGFFIGIIAAARTILGYILENVRMNRTKSAAEISSVTFTLGFSLWAVYGVSVSDPAIIGTDTFSVLTIFMALVLYFHNQRLHRAPGNSCAGRKPMASRDPVPDVLPRTMATWGRA